MTNQVISTHVDFNSVHGAERDYARGLLKRAGEAVQDEPKVHKLSSLERSSYTSVGIEGQPLTVLLYPAQKALFKLAAAEATLQFVKPEKIARDGKNVYMTFPKETVADKRSLLSKAVDFINMGQPPEDYSIVKVPKDTYDTLYRPAAKTDWAQPTAQPV